MSSNRYDILNSSSLSSNRILSDADVLNSKYNQYKRSLLASGGGSKVPNSQVKQDEASFLLSYPNETDSEKIQQLRKAYNDRLTSLYNNLSVIATNVQTDEVISTMRNDYRDNYDYIYSRVKEIIDEHLNDEKERTITRLTEENVDIKSRLNQWISGNSIVSTEYAGQLKGKVEEQECKIKNMEMMLNESYQKKQQLEFENEGLKSTIANLNQDYEFELNQVTEEFNAKLNKLILDSEKSKAENLANIDLINEYENTLKKIKSELQENKIEIDRLEKVISVLEIDLNASEEKLNEKNTKIEQLHNELTNIQSQHFEISLKHQKSIEDIKNLQTLVEHYEKERKEILDKYSSFNDELQSTHQEKLQFSEQKHKEKHTELKKKITELKSVITVLENELEAEKMKTGASKAQYSKLYAEMQENVKVISNEWEKKLRADQLNFERLISELETKHELEKRNMTRDHCVENENKNKELMKLKQSDELLKNFEKEFIRIAEHEEIINRTVSEMKRKTEKEIAAKEIECDAEYKKKLLKLEEEKKGEYDFLTENIRKNIRQLEKENTELKSQCMELEARFKKQVESNEKLESTCQNLQKTLRAQNSKLEEKENIIQNLIEKNNTYQETIKSFSNTHITFQSNIENLMENLASTEKERNAYYNELKEKEKEYNLEYNNFAKANARMEELEKTIEAIRNNNDFFKSKSENVETYYKMLEYKYQDILSKFKSLENDLEITKKKNSEMSKSLKAFHFQKETSNELIVKILKNKLNSLRNEISSIKDYYSNELSLVKKDYARAIEMLAGNIKIFKLTCDKEAELKIKACKEAFERDISAKIEETKVEKSSHVKKVEAKFERMLAEHQILYENLEKENRGLVEAQQNYMMKSKEVSFKLAELEQENKNLASQLAKLKSDNQILSENADKHRIEKMNLTKKKHESEEIGENSRRDIIKWLQTSLSHLVLLLVKMKKTYNQEIEKIKADIEDMSMAYESELNNNSRMHRAAIENLEIQLQSEMEEQKRLQNVVESKENEYTSIHTNLEKLKDIYENKIKMLNTKISSDEESIKELKSELKLKNEQLVNFSNLIHESKAHNKSLRNQLELKSDEVFNLKNEYEKLIIFKDKKITELQSIVNQSLYSYNSGVYNIKIANKLDDEVKVLMKRAKIEDPTDSLSGKK